MNRVILHIGRHKTGTTAIQKFLRENPELLESANYCYPDFGIRGFGHHELGAPLTRASLRTSEQETESVVENLRSGLVQSMPEDDAVTVLSSESFQLCDPRVVKSLFAGWDVQIVVYLREQVSYLLSSYAQKVHATDYSGTLAEYYTSTFTKDYEQFLMEWESAFPNSVTIRIYEKSELVGNNVVVDFCQSVLGIDHSEVAQRDHAVNANPSLTQDLLNFKLLVNQHLPVAGDAASLLYNGLAELALTDASGQIPVSNGQVKEIKKRFKKSNRTVAKKYFGRNQLFKEFSIKGQPQCAVVSNEISMEIRNKLLKISPDLAEALPSERFK